MLRTRKTLVVAVCACMAGSLFVGSHITRADDMSMSKDMPKDMSGDMMGKMKQMMSDPSMMPSTDDMAKAKAMHEMTMMMMKDPDMMKGGDQSKMMAPTDDAVAKAKEDLMKDPAAMKMMMANAMMMSMMKDKMPMSGDDMKMKQ